MSQASRSLPPHPSFEQQKKLARELLQAFDAGEADALDRVRSQLPDKTRITLADAQFVLAREYGFESWAKLKQHIQPTTAEPIPEAVHAEFTRAFAACDPDAVRTLLQRYPAARALINAPLFPFDSPALVHFAGEADLAMVNVLLDFGADPNRRTDWWAGGFHPLHAARGAVADRLIEAGAVPDACAAAQLDRLELLRSILDEDPARVHERGGDGQTPLHFARSRGVVDLLLERGADLDARDVDHRATPAQWMLDHKRDAGRYDLAAYLVERGAAVDIFLATALGLTERLRELLTNDRSLLDLRTGRGEYGEQPPSSFHIYTWTIGQNLSPLQVAVQFGQHDALEVLQSFAAPKHRFLAACVQGDAAEARRLLHDDPHLLDQLSSEDVRALPDAGWAGNTAAVELMLELGFDPTTPGQDGGTVLHCAAWEGVAPCVEAALRYEAVRALIERKDPTHGSTPLGWCCHGAGYSGNPLRDHAAIARMLLDAGARTIPDLDGTPEHVRAVIQAYVADRK